MVTTTTSPYLASCAPSKPGALPDPVAQPPPWKLTRTARRALSILVDELRLAAAETCDVIVTPAFPGTILGKGLARTGEHPPAGGRLGQDLPAVLDAQVAAGAVNPAAEPAPEPGVLQNRLAAEVASWGFRKFDQFRAVAIKMGILSGMEEDAGAYLELTNKTTKVFLASLGGLRKAMEAEYGVQAHEAGQEGGAE